MTLKQIQQRLEELNLHNLKWKKEVRELSKILDIDEILEYATYGTIEDKIWFFAITNKRIIILKKNLFKRVQISEISIEKINSIDIETNTIFNYLLIKIGTNSMKIGVFKTGIQPFIEALKKGNKNITSNTSVGSFATATHFKTLNPKKKFSIYKISIIISFLIIALINMLPEPTKNQTKNYSVEFSGKLVPTIIDNKVKLEILANVPDGAIMKTTLVGQRGETPAFEVQQVVMKDGKGEFIADVSDWEHGYLAAMSLLRFNADEIIQPDNVKELYGEHGEKMKGIFTQENHLKGFNGILKYSRIAYPSFEILKSEHKDRFENLLKNTFLKKAKQLVSNVEILELTDYSIRIDIIVNKNWDKLSLAQKERVVNNFVNAIKEFAVNNYQALNETQAVVFFMDKRGNEVAAPKTFGGYEIK